MNLLQLVVKNFLICGICIIEWGEKIKNLLPKNYLKINIEKDADDVNARKISFVPIGERYENIVKEVLEK